MTSAAYPWWRAAGALISEVSRYHLLSEWDANAIELSGYYADYFANCSAENRRHAERYARKLRRLLRRSGIGIGECDASNESSY